MSKLDRSELAKALGEQTLKGVAQGAKELAKEAGLGVSMTPGRANPAVTPIMEQLAQSASSVRLNIQRRDPVSGKWVFLRGPGEMDAQIFVSKSLPEIIDDWCGGGEYIVELSAPGQEKTSQSFTLGGAPQDPGYRAKPAIASGVSTGVAYDPHNYFGAPQRSFAPPQDNSSSIVNKMLEMMMAQQMMQTRMSSMPTGQPSAEVSELKAELARMRNDQQRAEDERRRADDERRRTEELERLRREAAEDRRRNDEKLEKLLAEMNKDKTPAWVGLAQAAVPAITAFMANKDATMGLLSNTFGTVLQAQQQAANQQAETFKVLMQRPSAADEISKMTSVFAQSQLTNLQTINQIVSSGLLDKGGGHPLVDLVSQLIDQGGQVLQAAVGNAAQQDGGMAGLPAGNGQILDAEVNPPMLASASAPQAAPAAEKQYDLNADPSFRVIIEQIKGGGDPREIALRLYRHGQPLREDQGHPLAKSWCRDPKNHSQFILAQIGVSQSRIDQIVDALYALSTWVQEGKDPEDFARVETRRRRRKKALPAASPEMQSTQGYTFVEPSEDEGEEDDEEGDDEDLEEMPNDGVEEAEPTVDIKTPVAESTPTLTVVPSEA
jgi:hypothetical protein